MDIKGYEQIRRKTSKIFIGFLIASFVLMIATIIFLIFVRLDVSWWQYLLLAVAAALLILLSIYSAEIVERIYFKKYNNQFQDAFVNKKVFDVFDVYLNEKSKTLDISDLVIINSKHKYRVLNEIHTNQYSIYEVSMLKDLRFRGLVIVKELKEEIEPFIFVNYEYYYQPKITIPEVKTNIEKFDNKYKLYSNNENFILPSGIADKLFNRLQTFNQVGVVVKDNYAYYVLGNKLNLKNVTFFNIPLLDEIDDDYELKLKIFLQKVASICEYDFT